MLDFLRNPPASGTHCRAAAAGLPDQSTDLPRVSLGWLAQYPLMLTPISGRSTVELAGERRNCCRRARLNGQFPLYVSDVPADRREQPGLLVT